MCQLGLISNIACASTASMSDLIGRWAQFRLIVVFSMFAGSHFCRE
jgi:hypothetical protein